MAIQINGTVTLDESADLQNSTNTSVPAEDANDNDVALSVLQSEVPDFYDRLFGALELNLDDTFALDNGVAESADDFIDITTDNDFLSAAFGINSGDGTASGLFTLDGTEIYLYSDPADSNIVYGVKGDQGAGPIDPTMVDIVFALYFDLNQTGVDSAEAQIWMVQFEALDNPDDMDPDDAVDLAGLLTVTVNESLSFDFNDLPSGQNLFGTIAESPMDTGIIVIGKEPDLDGDNEFTNTSDTINTSKGGGPTTIGVNNQMIDPGEGVYFTFVNDIDANYLSGFPGGLDQNEADDADNILYSGGTFETNSAFFVISQVQGNSLATAKITAYDIAGAPQGVDFVNDLGTGTQIDVIAVRVFDENGILLEDSDMGGMQDPDIMITFSMGMATVTGLDAGYTVEYDTAFDHDQVLIEGIAGKFDLGGFGLAGAQETQEIFGAEVRFEDDGPTAAIALNDVMVVVDETDGETAPFELDPIGGDLGATTITGAVLFNDTSEFGTDGMAAMNATVYSLELNSGGTGDSGLDDTLSGEDILLVDNGGVIEGRTEFGNDLVFEIEIDAMSGDLTLTQYRAVVHPDPMDPDESVSMASGEVNLKVKVTDGDGDMDEDVADLTIIKFEDDAPMALIALNDVDIIIDETDGETAPGEIDPLGGDLGSLTITGALLFANIILFGSDGMASSNAVVYSVELPNGDGSDSGLDDTLSGENILLIDNSGTIEGRTEFGDDLVFTIAINSTTGDLTVTQFRAVVHADPMDPNDLAIMSFGEVNVKVTATDGDGDMAMSSGSLDGVAFRDDAPDIGPIMDGQVDFENGSMVTNPLNLTHSSDGDTTIITAFTDHPTLSEFLSADGTMLTYYDDSIGMMPGVLEAGEEVFKLSLINLNGTGDYVFEVLADPPPDFIEFSFDTLPSGQNLFGTVADSPSSPGIIIIGSDPVVDPVTHEYIPHDSDTINTSKGGGPTTIGVNNQMINPGEDVYFTYVNDIDANYLSGFPGGLDQNEADDADNILYSGGTIDVTTAFVQISQVQGNQLVTMEITAFDMADAPQGFDFVDMGLGTGIQREIIAVRVFDENGIKIEDTDDLGSFDDPDVDVDLSGLAALISGLDDDYTIEFDTDGLHNQAHVEGIEGKFDLGLFGIEQPEPIPDQELEFTVQITDGDGDSASDSFTIGIDGTGIYDDGVIVI